MTRGWNKEEKMALIKRVQESFEKKEPIKFAFEDFAKNHGRKFGSVRNFYYSYLQSKDDLPEGIKKNDIVVFSKRETAFLLAKIMEYCKNGLSVRGAISKLTADKKKRLRLQNKYRNLVKANSPIIYKIMEKQKATSAYYNPFKKCIVEIENQPLKVLVKDDRVALQNKALASYFDDIDALSLNENV